MKKVLISMPDQLATRMRATIPVRQRSKLFTRLIEREIEKCEKALCKCAASVEKDMTLRHDMEDWKVTVQDGLDDESR